ncbi:tagaturonate reductase [Phaeodactylibacter sp.]|uniref:tagaturonate reductase n=1 Tax=Phaeodactylibacter sp. TaxID=1940289 RepID=UPI0025FCAD1A|nr:tagaturonate reductase [Phaeodactylibacter sp.]MCI5091415.1 tagaturonate reductase [Phaeodactylibacter sp.]
MQILSSAAVGQETAHPIRVLQFGGGNFLRAFADYLIQILNEETAFGGGVALVKPTAGGDYASLRQQDGLFHVLTQGIQDGQPVREIKRVECIQQIIHPYQNWTAYMSTATLPEVRFVLSNTTEAGIAFHEEPMPADAPAKDFPGKLTQWLFHRFQHFEGAEDKGLIFLPCELIEQNGQELKNCILEYSRYWNLGEPFESWIETHNIFCNTLVDRIVPGTPANAAEIWAETGWEDRELVTAEPYLLWAIEATEQVKQELPFDQTGQNVVFTDDLDRFRTLKVRLLNGAHTAMVPVGLTNGVQTVREFVEHPQWGTWLTDLLQQEIAPTLPFSNQEIQDYIVAILDRFRNPYIHHKLSAIALNSTSKFRVRLLPTAIAYHQKMNTLPEHIAQSLAALILLYKGDISGLPRDSEEAVKFFEACWALETPDLIVDKVLSNKGIWGEDIRFLSASVHQYLQSMLD